MWPRSLAQRSVGAGDISLTRSAARGIDAHDLTRAVHATLEAGIDLVDIAPEDDAERLVGDALRALRLRDRTLVLTRVPALAATASGAETSDLLRERLPQRYLQDRIERSLRATRLDALPVAMLELRASWRDSPAWPEFVDACARLVRDGKVLAYGAYVDRIEDDTAALFDESWLAALNIPFSLCERAAESVLAKALELRVRASDDATSRGDADRPRDDAREPNAQPLLDADPALAAAAARDPNIAAVLASSITGVSENGLLATEFTGVSSAGTTEFTGVSSAGSGGRGAGSDGRGSGAGVRGADSAAGAHALVDPRIAAKDPVVAAALARDPKLAAALGIELPRGPARDVAILARRPLAGGALAGTLGPGAKLRKDDDRKLDRNTLERIAVGVAKLAALVKEVPAAARSCDAAKLQLERNRRPEHVECATLPELALRFAIDRGAIPLPRLHHREHVADALAAAIAPPLPRDLTENLDI